MSICQAFCEPEEPLGLRTAITLPVKHFPLPLGRSWPMNHHCCKEYIAQMLQLRSSSSPLALPPLEIRDPRHEIWVSIVTLVEA